ncbi:MAG: tetratricopeptide repeat protein, partial [Inquilinus sp.]|nr:tetratricopeptide repeat protein [Inquilinus sp.]
MRARNGKAKQRDRKQRKAQAAAPTSFELRRRLDDALARLEAGDAAVAGRKLDDLARLAPRDAEIRHALGYALHCQGRPAAAVGALERAVALDPDAAGYRNSLGIVLLESGETAAAVAALSAAVERQPDNPAYRFNLGNALKAAERFDEAAAAYREALAAAPGDPEILNNMGVALTRAGRPAEAIEMFRQALVALPREAQILHNIGLAYHELADHAAALDSFGACLAADPGFDPALLAIARVHDARRSETAAIDGYRHYLARRPDDADVVLRLVELLQAARRHDEAAQWLELLQALRPDDPVPARAMGRLLADRNRIDAAVAAYRAVLDRHPEDSETMLDLAHVDVLTERLDDAADWLDRAAAIDPDSGRLAFLRALVAESRGDLPAAARHQDDCLARLPDDAVMREHRGRLHLALGELEPGFRLYDARYRRSGTLGGLPAPLWRGEELAGRKLLIAAEQGIGDEIIFGSCLPDAIRAAGACAIECDERLVPLYRRSFPGALVHASTKTADKRQAIREYDWLGEFGTPDYAIPMGSLARHFRRAIGDFPAPGGYLAADPEAVAGWRRRLDALGPGLKVGLCWRSGLRSPDRTRFYTEIDDWAPLLSMPGIVPVNLQYGDCATELEHAERVLGTPLHGFADLDLFDDIDGMAAMMRALDVVVSVSTVTPYLAAAVGQTALVASLGRDWTLLGTDRYP